MKPNCDFHGSSNIWRLGTSDNSAWACAVCFTASLEGDEPSMLEKSRAEEIMDQLNQNFRVEE